MIQKRYKSLPLMAMTLLVAGCATGPGGTIYVPADQSPAYEDVPEPPQVEAREKRIRKSELPPAEQAEEPQAPQSSAPSYQEQGEPLSPAASSLVSKAEGQLTAGDVQGAVSTLERAQRISPRSAEVYYKLSQAYVRMDNFAKAEQFTLKGLSLAGNNTRLQRAGWMLLADIRRANGNTAGANQAEARAAAL
ncbi:MAG: tetratricopeptide repeat protein [Marinobacter sp.]|uniref:tetratricopeptide repeat protein n=1 Tax=Marinobacter sp. TaxID=50741 RepID=UPI00299EC9B1|nr:tetratricopeptide repeat protein [Marinobacter sp.]MDX1634430.1 tetratricopeptide repeat protein [Marinobacter sp.]